MDRMLNMFCRANWPARLLSIVIVTALILFPVRILYAHDHNLDGERHPDCPVNKYLASYFVDGVANSVSFGVTSHFTISCFSTTRRLKLSLFFNPRIERGPPALS